MKTYPPQARTIFDHSPEKDVSLCLMKTRDIVRSVLAAAGIGLALYVFFSARSCVRERRWLALGPIENHPVRIYDVKFAQEFGDPVGVRGVFSGVAGGKNTGCAVQRSPGGSLFF